MAQQVALLRVLETRMVSRIGDSSQIPVDVRIICATNKNLYDEVKAGRFRSDLYYRLNVINLHIPPLRERKGDIYLLIGAFIKKFGSGNFNKKESFSDEKLIAFYEYDWPGNVRELQNVVEYYVICSEEGSEPGPDFVSQILQRNSQSPEYGQFPAPVYSGTPFATAPACPVPLQVTGEKTLFELRDAYEKLLIEDALARTPNSSKAAQLLGIYPSSLYRKMLKYGIQPQDGDTYGERI